MQNAVLNNLRAEMERILVSFVENPAKDFPSYLQRVGQWNGLNDAVQIVAQAQQEDEDTPTF